ncbi:MAG: flagellar basal body rod protein [Myxococcota bacterium]
MDTVGIALSGMQSASTRLAVSAHNVANGLTDGFRPQRVAQTAQASGGAQAVVVTAPGVEPVAFEREVVDQIQARTQFEGSARVLGAHAEMLGSLLDLFA